MEDEVYSVLGALLGMLEVLSIDTQAPLSERQRRFVNDALRFGDLLRARVEALVTLFSDERDERHQRAPYALRRLIDHSVRAASWAAAEKGVSIVLPAADSSGIFLLVDAARVDRALRSITDTLVSALGKDGQVALRVEDRPESVLLALSAGPASAASAPALALSSIMLSSWQRLFGLQGGSMHVDAPALSVSIELPKVPAGAVP
jgi:signal transduction histidine kinase